MRISDWSSDVCSADLVVDWFGTSALVARGLHAVITFAAASFVLGAFTRTSALVLLVGWAQFAAVLPAADRGIDTLSSVERRVGTECVMTCRTRWWQSSVKKN